MLHCVAPSVKLQPLKRGFRRKLPKSVWTRRSPPGAKQGLKMKLKLLKLFLLSMVGGCQSSRQSVISRLHSCHSLTDEPPLPFHNCLRSWPLPLSIFSLSQLRLGLFLFLLILFCDALRTGWPHLRFDLLHGT